MSDTCPKVLYEGTVRSAVLHLYNTCTYTYDIHPRSLPGADGVVRGLWPGTAAIVFHPRARRTDRAVVHGLDVGLEELEGSTFGGF
jgi:hypothetical protein